MNELGINDANRAYKNRQCKAHIINLNKYFEKYRIKQLNHKNDEKKLKKVNV